MLSIQGSMNSRLLCVTSQTITDQVFPDVTTYTMDLNYNVTLQITYITLYIVCKVQIQLMVLTL